MKNQYINGMITGAFLMLVTFLLFGENKEIGRYTKWSDSRLLDTKTGEVFIGQRVDKENSMFKKELSFLDSYTQWIRIPYYRWEKGNIDNAFRNID